MAVLYDVVSNELDNSTCSALSVHKQFPILDSFEHRVAELQQDRQHKTWWRTAYGKHTQLGSGWEFQRKGTKLLRLVANHTARCKELGHTCAVYNAWEPEECFPHDDLVKSWSPSCQEGMQIPRRPPRVRRKATDWLGLVQDCGEGLESERPQTQPEMTRMLECLGLPWGPVAGEDYFETLCLLQAVKTATSTSTFVVVEAGASVGYWAPKAAKAFRRRFPDTGACHLVLIDSMVAASSAAANLQHNGIYDLCNITFLQSRATASLLDRLIDFFGRVDLLHVDIQEAELELVQRSVRLPQVQHLFVGTHGRKIHRQVRSFLAYHGFAIDFDYVGKSFLRTPIGPVVFGDGVLAACGARRERKSCLYDILLQISPRLGESVEDRYSPAQPMDSFSAGPIVYSTLEADELYESADDSDEGQGEGAAEAAEVTTHGHDSKMRMVNSRFRVWKQSAGKDCSIINEIFDRLHVHSHEVTFASSVRCLKMDFSIVGMRGVYEQRSCADPSPTWELSQRSGQLVQVPNLKATWLLDEETVLTCCHYAGEATESWVDEKRLAERFGSETLERMGGLSILLELIGLICADAGAGYAAQLPFGLPEAVVYLREADTPPRAEPSGGYGMSKEVASAFVPKAPKPLPATSAVAFNTSKTLAVVGHTARHGCCHFFKRPPALWGHPVASVSQPGCRRPLIPWSSQPKSCKMRDRICIGSSFLFCKADVSLMQMSRGFSCCEVDFEDSLHRYGASNERLEQLLQEEKEVLESATPEDVLAGLRPMVLQGMMVLSSYHRLDQDSWYTAVSVLDSYLAKAGELDVGKLPLTCVAVVRLVKKFHGNVADQFGSTSAQWLDGARQLAKAMQDQGHQMESLEFTEIMLSQHEIDILEVLQWQIDAPLLQQWLSTYCQRFNILTDHKHETAVSWVKTRAMYFARLLLFVEASSSRSPPREFALGLFCLGLVWSQLLPADCLRPEKVPSAYWVAGFQELSQRHRVQTMTHSRTKKRHPAAEASRGSRRNAFLAETRGAESRMAGLSRAEAGLASASSMTSSDSDSLASMSWLTPSTSWLGRLMARLLVVACGVLEVVVVIPSIFAELELMSLSIGPWPLVLRLAVSLVRLAPVIGALARCLYLPRLWNCVPECLRWRMQGYTGMLQTAEVRWGVAITLDMWYLLSTPLNVGLQEAWFGILLVANIFLCFVDTVTLLAALSTKPRPPVQTAEGRSLHRARHVKLTPEEGMPQTCAICLCDFEEDEAAVQLPCSHVFHFECITAWLQRSRHCPMRCPELVLPPRRSRTRGAAAEVLHQERFSGRMACALTLNFAFCRAKARSVPSRPRPVPQNVTQPSMAFRALHRPRGTRLLACGIAALLLGSAFSALSFVTTRAPAPRAASRVPVQFFGSKAPEPAKYEDETLGDKIKAAWKNENTQKFIAFVATASTALDVLGVFTGEASVTAGIGEALASLDTGVALQEGQTAAEALADAAQSADFSESSETLSDLSENLKNLK
eukprot:s2623_g1.t1